MVQRSLLVLTVGGLLAAGAGAVAGPQQIMTKGLTAVAGVKVGHYTLAERPTGCTVVLVEQGAVAGVDVRGGAPGTRETDLLDPANTVQQVHAIVLAGGSAFGLDAASGVMRYLEERGIGFKTATGPVPIVPAAILIDLQVGDNPKVRPTADCGYRAALAASTDVVAEGNVGAGAGATIGKIAGFSHAMKGGTGTASIALPNGTIVAALVVVNAAGDVIDPSTGRVVAGMRTGDGRGLADVRLLLRQRPLAEISRPGVLENTTLGVVATNARLTKAQATKLAQMAQDGIARAIAPAHTPWDGDTVFALAAGTEGTTGPGGATGVNDSELLQLGALAADVVADAIVRAARAATSIPGYPAARDLR